MSFRLVVLQSGCETKQILRWAHWVEQALLAVYGCSWVYSPERAKFNIGLL